MDTMQCIRQLFRPRLIIPTAAVLILLTGLACGGGTASTAQEDAGNASGLAGMKGDIHIDGSSTVFPISEAVAEEFGKLTGGKVRITVGISGTGGGFKKFCNGETHIANASRAIKTSEVKLCAESGIAYIEIPVAIDGLTVMVNLTNDFIECLTVEELHTIWAEESEDTVTRWNQVRAEWPDEPMRLYGPGVDSGTFDYFTNAVNNEAQVSRGDFTASEDDNVLVQGISGDKYSLGYFGYSYYYENRAKLKAVKINGGDGCVTPAETTINDGTYKPLSRPLFIYLSETARQQPHIAEFIRYYLGHEGQQLAAEVGYVPFQPELYELALNRVEMGRTGTIFGGATPEEGSLEEVLAANQ